MPDVTSNPTPILLHNEPESDPVIDNTSDEVLDQLTHPPETSDLDSKLTSILTKYKTNYNMPNIVVNSIASDIFDLMPDINKCIDPEKKIANLKRLANSDHLQMKAISTRLDDKLIINTINVFKDSVRPDKYHYISIKQILSLLLGQSWFRDEMNKEMRKGYQTGIHNYTYGSNFRRIFRCDRQIIRIELFVDDTSACETYRALKVIRTTYIVYCFRLIICPIQ